MLPENFANAISIYAALVSTFLGGREIWKERIRIATSCYSIGDPDQEDIITIYNKSSKPIIINYFSIEKNGKEIELRNPADFFIITIKPQEVYSITIDGSYKFQWNGKIFLKLQLMGKKKSKRIKLDY
ncbi:hypothetical protein ACQ7CX_09635 [Chryseobacterium arthrosphaerae]|uniref:hypothetical protein n=1 Tax=Chryseobacterium arthrosphaerae TaxID=651561 RepID=UPI001BAF6DB6|nr:hypothetical protein [Chryseobacterium arthrosphaerae]QUY53706.1 hypothetical protein I2F65_12495 [Chryseobacterium arthrosphaerae]